MGRLTLLTRCIAMELGPQGIRCNAMAPGIIATDMTAASPNDASHSGDWLRRIPQRRYGTPEDVLKLLQLGDCRLTAAWVTGIIGASTVFAHQ